MYCAFLCFSIKTNDTLDIDISAGQLEGKVSEHAKNPIEMRAFFGLHGKFGRKTGLKDLNYFLVSTIFPE